VSRIVLTVIGSLGDLHPKIAIALELRQRGHVDKFSPYLVLAMFSSVLAKSQPDWATNTVVTGFTFYDENQNKVELTPELQHFLDAGEPPKPSERVAQRSLCLILTTNPIVLHELND